MEKKYEALIIKINFLKDKHFSSKMKELYQKLFIDSSKKNDAVNENFYCNPDLFDYKSKKDDNFMNEIFKCNLDLFHFEPHSFEKNTLVYCVFALLGYRYHHSNSLAYATAMIHFNLGVNTEYDLLVSNLNKLIKVKNDLGIGISSYLSDTNLMFEMFKTDANYRIYFRKFYASNKWDSMSLLFIHTKDSLLQSLKMGNPMANYFLHSSDVDELKKLRSEQNPIAIDTLACETYKNNRDPIELFNENKDFSNQTYYGWSCYLLGYGAYSSRHPSDDDLKMGAEYIFKVDKFAYISVVEILLDLYGSLKGKYFRYHGDKIENVCNETVKCVKDVNVKKLCGILMMKLWDY